MVPTWNHHGLLYHFLSYSLSCDKEIHGIILIRMVCEEPSARLERDHIFRVQIENIFWKIPMALINQTAQQCLLNLI